MKCNKCKSQRVIGARCLHCYVTDYAKRIKTYYKWFIFSQREFERILITRFRTIEMGFEPPPIPYNKLYTIFYSHSNHTQTPYRYGSGKPKYTGMISISRVVHQIDREARKAHELANNNSQDRK